MAETVTIVGTKIDNTTVDETIGIIVRWIDDHGVPRYVVTPNVGHIIRLQHDNEFRKIYQDADLVVADEVPLIRARKFS